MRSYCNPIGIWIRSWSATTVKVTSFMKTIAEGNLAFHFKPNLGVLKYDESHYYLKLDPRPHGLDFVAAKKGVAPPTCWLIEVKDFRNARGNPNDAQLELVEKVEKKVRQTLAGLAEMAGDAEGAVDETEKATLCLKAVGRRVVLHLERYVGPEKIFKNVPNPSYVAQKLKPKLSDIDPNLLVTDIARTKKLKLPWTVSAK